MGGKDIVQITLDDIEVIKAVAVQEAKLEILVKDFQSSRKTTDENIVKIFELIRSFPEKMIVCRDDLETDIHHELELHYATKPRIDALETDINNRFDKSDSRVKWTIGVIVSGAGIIQFFTTMWFMGAQISKITGGG